MYWYRFVPIVLVFYLEFVLADKENSCCNDEGRSLSTWQGTWSIFPTTATWSLQTRIPMTSGLARCCMIGVLHSRWRGSFGVCFQVSTNYKICKYARLKIKIDYFADTARGERGKNKYKKKIKKMLLPLLLAYKLKFFTLIPVLIGGLVLLTGATGLAGFFFALFAAVMGLKSTHGHRTF